MTVRRDPGARALCLIVQPLSRSLATGPCNTFKAHPPVKYNHRLGVGGIKHKKQAIAIVHYQAELLKLSPLSGRQEDKPCLVQHL